MGGSADAVTADNRIEYVHLMADYRLNKQIAPQCKALLTGLHAVVPAGWLRLFNTPELQRLVSGDDVPVDMADLRKHTKYAGGYNDLSPTVRDLWAILNEFGRDERALFLKFVTSCSKPPLLGFVHLHPPFCIQCVNTDGNEVRGSGARAMMVPLARRRPHTRPPVAWALPLSARSRGSWGLASRQVPSVLAFFGMGRKEVDRLPTSATCFNLLKLPNFKSKKILREKLLLAIRSASGFDLS